MKIPSNILHDKQYADKILEITADTMFFVYKDGTCLDFKANTTDFFIKEQDIIGRNIFGIKEQIDTITNRYNKWLYLFHISSC